MTDEREDYVQNFFTKDEWERMTSVERTRYSNTFKKYKKKLELCLPVTAPDFIQRWYSDHCRRLRRERYIRASSEMPIKKEHSPTHEQNHHAGDGVTRASSTYSAKEIPPTQTPCWKSGNDGVTGEMSGRAREPVSSVTSEIVMDSNSPNSIFQGGTMVKLKKENTQNVSNSAGGLASSLKLEKNEIKFHSVGSTIKAQYKCYVCGEQIDRKSELVSHLKDHIGPKRFECDECGQKFKRFRSLKRHLSSISAESDGETFRCSYCSHSYMKNSSRINHERVHQKITPCCLCELKFPGVQSLMDHVQKVHQKHKAFKCTVCGKCFSHNTHLQRHIREVSRDFPYKCLVCGHKYISELSLMRHSYQHGKSKSEKCSFCLQMFTNKFHLSRHLKRRERSEDYQCTGCNKKFATNLCLQRHLKIYNADRPFRCSQCDHTFISQRYLDSHMWRIHWGEGWKCKACGETFKNKRFLQTHKQIHRAKSSDVRNNQCKRDHNQSFGQPKLPDFSSPKSRTFGSIEELRSGCGNSLEKSSLPSSSQAHGHSLTAHHSHQHCLHQEDRVKLCNCIPCSQTVHGACFAQDMNQSYLHYSDSDDLVDVECLDPPEASSSPTGSVV